MIPETSLTQIVEAIERFKALILSDVSQAYAPEFTSACDLLEQSDPVAFDVLRGWLGDNKVWLVKFDRYVADHRRNRKAEARVQKKGGSQGSVATAPVGIVGQPPAPWDDPVTGDELLFAIYRFVTRFVYLPFEATHVAVVLWIAFSYIVDFVDVSPRLIINSPVKRCGKTRLLDVLVATVARPLPASNLTTAAVFRTIQQEHPTLVIDEADTFINADPELAGVLNSGHTRSTAFVVRCAGDDQTPTRFSTWAAFAIAGIGRFRATLMDRSIVIPMKRKPANEKVEKLGRRNKVAAQQAEEIARMATRWAADNRAAIEAAYPDLPSLDGDDRAADNWEPLLAIADLAGGIWPEKAREAAKILTVGRESDAPDGETLLADIRVVFHAENATEISSDKLAVELAKLDGRPWAAMGNQQKPITTIRLARMLKNFERAPGFPLLPSKITGGERGYTLEDFKLAFDSYLPPEPDDSEVPF